MSHGNLRTPVRFALVLLLVLAVMVISVMADADNSSVPDTSLTDADITVIETATMPPVMETATEVPTIMDTLIPTLTSTAEVTEFPAPSVAETEVPAFTPTDVGSSEPTPTVEETNAAVSYSLVNTKDVMRTTVSTTGIGLANTPWPKYMRDNNNTGRSPYIGSQTNTVKWTYTTGGQISYSSAAVDSDGTIYIGSQDGNFYAINPDGTKKWSYATGAVSTSASIGSDGIIYIGGGNNLYALNPDGTLQWQYSTIGSVKSSPVVKDDIIYFVSKDGVYALHANGTLKWSYASILGGNGAPAIGTDETIYLSGYSDKKLYALNSDGTLKWSYTTTGYIYGSPSIGSDGTIYFGNRQDQKLYALNPDGTLKWSYTAGIIYGTPAIGIDGTIYFGSYNKNVYALNPDGTLKWSYTTGGFVNYFDGSPSIGADGVIYIGNYGDNKIYALNPDGTFKWSYTAGDKFINTPSIGPDGTVYIGNYDSKLYAFAGVLDYSADKTSGGAPLAVQFTGTSSLSVTSWHWDFGDGMTSDEQNPLHTYSSVGSYTVKLTATNSDGTVYYHILPNYIKVYSPPVSGFMADTTSGIYPLTVQFTDQSTNSPTSWTWDFGDGSSTNATTQNPVHTYAAAGTYTVNLTATNAAGSNTATISGYITVSSPPDTPPVVSFKATPRISTTAPLTVQFRDTSTLSPTSWLWDFGDGDSTNATKQNPVHTYVTAGNYTVNLTATNAVGQSTATKSGFITFVTPGPIPAQNNVNLYVANDEGIKYDFPDGVNADGPYNYIPNTYFLHMTGGLNAFGMTDENNADIIRTRNQSGTLWAWFAGGQTTMPDGILMLAVNGTIPDDFAVHIRSSGYNWTPGGPGTYNAGTPTEYNYVEGAVNQTFTKSDFIYGPQIWRPCSEGDYPIYSRQDMSNTGDTFRIMFIDLNAGSPRALPNSRIKVEYSFTNLTSFAAFDVYGWYGTSNHGTGIIMTNSKSMEWTIIGIPDAPVADFTSGTDTVDILSPVRFTDTSANVPQSWLWEFGDGTTSTEENPVHTYTAPGTYTVKLTVTNYKGTDSETKTGYITKIIPPVPVADFTANATSGISPCPVQFTDQSTGIVFSHTWDFGDGTNSTEQNPLHWYAPGTYPINLTVTNSGGSNSTLKTSYVTVTSNGRTNQFGNPGFETGDLAGWTSNTPYISSSYVHTGNYAAGLTGGYIEQHVDLTGVSDISFWGYKSNNQLATDQHFAIYIDGQSKGSFSQTCIYTWLQYTLPISGYSGVHTVKIATAGITYDNCYIDDILATVGSSGGTIPPVASFTASPTTGTAPLAVTFTDTSANLPTSWLWDFGDGSTSLEQNATHTYTLAGTYTVNLTVTNAAGSNTTTKTGYISVSENPADRARLILPAASLYQNNATQLPVQVMNITNGTGISFDLAYDPAVIRVDEITLNQSYESGSNLAVNATPGMIRLSFTRTDGINIKAPVPVFFVNTTGIGTVGARTSLNASGARWSDGTFNYRQFDVVHGTLQVRPIRGDFNENGFVDIGDVARVAYMVVEKTPSILPDADFNNNGRVDVGDATKIAWYIVGKITEL